MAHSIEQIVYPNYFTN